MPIRPTLLALVFATLAAWASAAPAAQPPPAGGGPPAAAADAPWSARMAEAVMQRRPLVRERWDYETGTVLRGFEELWRETGDRRYFDYIRRNVDAYVEPDGTIRTFRFEDFNLDNIKTGDALLLLARETDDPRYRRAAETLRRQLAEQPTTSEGGYWHKQIYPYQIWLDGLYMAEPFAVLHALGLDDPAARHADLAHAALQFQLAARYLRDPATGLLYHGWDESRQMAWADPVTGRSENFWGRAIGWYAMGLADVLEHFPADHPDRDALAETFVQLAEAVVRVQDPVSGVWWQVLDQPNREGNYLESSASAMFVYALAKGARLGLLGERYGRAARRGYDGLLREFVVVADDGLVSLTRVVSVGGLGGPRGRDGSFAYYLSEPVVSDDPKGTGPFILASVEMERIGHVSARR